MYKLIFKSEYKNSWGLIIGINDYVVGPLNYATNDAESVAEILKERFSFPEKNITLLLDKEATRAKIMRSLLKFSKENVNPDDRLLIFFAGHGHTFPSVRGDVGYLIPADGELDDLSTLIRWDDLTKNAEIIQAKHIFFIMDACYGGLAITRSLNTGNMRFLKDMLRRYSRQVLTAGKANETVADSGGPISGHSIFTGHLLQALEGNAANSDGIITANTVMSYVYEKVSKDLHSRQTPHFGYLDGDGDFIFKAQILKSLKKETTEDKDVLIEIESPLEQNNNIYISENVIEKVKEYISDNRFRIKLEDTVNQEIRKLLAVLNEENFPVNIDVSPEILTERLKKYEAAINNLQGIIISLTHWGKQSHNSIISKIVARISEQIQSNSGRTVWLALQWYPSLILLYSGGISSIAAENYDNLATLFNTRIGSSYYDADEEIILPIGKAISDIEGTNIFKTLPEHEKYYVPRSEYIFKLLQPNFDDLLFLGKSYERFFDNFEIFLALVHADYREKKGLRIWGPVGRFGWKNRRYNTLQEFFNDANSKKTEWRPIKAGLFDGSFERFTQIFIEYQKIILNLPWL